MNLSKGSEVGLRKSFESAQFGQGVPETAFLAVNRAAYQGGPREQVKPYLDGQNILNRVTG